MSKYSEIVDGNVLPFKFKKRKTDTVFSVGNITIGTLYNIRDKWSAVSVYENHYGVIKGFSTRLDAAEYLLQVFRQHREKNVKKFQKGVDKGINT